MQERTMQGITCKAVKTLPKGQPAEGQQQAVLLFMGKRYPGYDTWKQ